MTDGEAVEISLRDAFEDVDDIVVASDDRKRAGRRRHPFVFRRLED